MKKHPATHKRRSLNTTELWQAIKWSNQNADGSVTINAERVSLIDKLIAKEEKW